LLSVARVTLLDYLGAIDALLVRRGALESSIGELVPCSPWAQTVTRLRALRGIDTLSAVGLCAEIGDWERFQRPGHLMSYLGLVPSEHSSGETRRQGQITKSGSGHGRRLLVEAAWHYRRAPAKGQALKGRQENQTPQVLAISWAAQQRLHRTWRRLDDERGKRERSSRSLSPGSSPGSAGRSPTDPICTTSVKEAAGTIRPPRARASTS
jgi:transposase